MEMKANDPMLKVQKVNIPSPFGVRFQNPMVKYK